MFLHASEIFYFCILPILFFVTMMLHYKTQAKEYYTSYNEIKDKYQNLLTKFNAINKINVCDNLETEQTDDNENECSITKHCDICNSTENIHYYPTSGFKIINGNKVFLSGGFNICDECLNICQKCECGKLKIPYFLAEYVNDIMESALFCNCEEDNDRKLERYNKEKLKFDIMLSKRKYKKIVDKYKE